MRRLGILAVLLATSCAEPPPARIVAPASPLPPPVPMGQRDGSASPAQRSGEPAQAPFDIGGAGQGPVMPNQVSPAFRGL
jgi:hypothetical protein